MPFHRRNSHPKLNATDLLSLPYHRTTTLGHWPMSGHAGGVDGGTCESAPHGWTEMSTTEKQGQALAIPKLCGLPGHSGTRAPHFFFQEFPVLGTIDYTAISGVPLGITVDLHRKIPTEIFFIPLRPGFYWRIL